MMKRVGKTDNKISPINISLFFAGVISLYFHRNTADPFNAPKLWLLILAAAWLIGYLIKNKHMGNIYKNNSLKTIQILIILFQLSSLVGLIFSDVKLTSFFGDTQRKVGFITYLCFSIFMLFAAKFARKEQFKTYYLFSSITGIIFLIYGIIQATGNDFVKWVNPYNSIIGTLGNPNFAAAFMALFATLFFSIIFVKSFSILIRITSAFIALITLYCIQLSDARQGILAAAAGIIFFIGGIIYFKSKLFGLFFAVITFIGSIFVILGMLQHGPLVEFLYKDSVSIRGYYWRAGISMFRDNFLTGVGLDRYGAYFKEYQEVNYGLKIGFDITSTNAHNIPIQLFATGGVFLGTFYLLIISFILYRGIISIKKFQADERVFFLGLISAWITYQAQSIVSIENIGLGVWGWLLGGTIVGLSYQVRDQDIDTQKKSRSNSINMQSMFSFLLLIMALIPVAKLVQAENTMYAAQINYDPENPLTVNFAQKVLEAQFIDNDYKYSAANMMLRANEVEQGITALENLIKNDPRNNYYLLALAQALEYKVRNFDAIKVREQITVFDPNNVKNYLQLGRLYKLSGDTAKANQMRLKILSFAPNTAQAQAATAELSF